MVVMEDVTEEERSAELYVSASGSGHQKSESYKTQFESQSQRNIHLKRIKAIDNAS